MPHPEEELLGGGPYGMGGAFVGAAYDASPGIEMGCPHEAHGPVIPAYWSSTFMDVRQCGQVKAIGIGLTLSGSLASTISPFNADSMGGVTPCKLFDQIAEMLIVTRMKLAGGNETRGRQGRFEESARGQSCRTSRFFMDYFARFRSQPIVQLCRRNQ